MTMPDKLQLLCACPDYFHGTGKPTKRKTTCKQCKRIRLPFKPVGGTLRMLSPPCAMNATVARNCFATVRLPPTSSFDYQRPTILYGEYDPYNFLRQSRLLYTVSNHFIWTIFFLTLQYFLKHLDRKMVSQWVNSLIWYLKTSTEEALFYGNAI